MSGYIDLHCHVLPGVDDGPQDVEAAVALVQGMAGLGFAQIYPTPHQKQGSWTPTPEETAAAAEELHAGLALTECTATVHPPAGENMWDGLFLERQDSDSFPFYPGGKSFLVEFSPQAVPPMLKERFFQFRLAGKLAVVAHVERYPALTRDLEHLEELAQGAALLVNLSALSSWWIGREARRLVKAGVVHAAATDCHSAEDIKACRKGIAWLRSTVGDEATQILLEENPRRILDGDLPVID